MMKLLSLPAALSAPLLLALAVGCGDDKTETGTEDPSAGATTEDETSTTGELEPPEPLLARGIRLNEIYADQGVSVPIGLDLQPVGGGDRNAYLVADRQTMIRAFLDVEDEDNWVDRELKATLTLHYADGTSQAADQKILVEGDSDPRVWDTTFNWVMPPELMQPDMSFEVTVWEVDQAMAETPEPEEGPVFPLSGTAFIGIEDSYMVLKVAMIPIDHQLEGKECGGPVEITEADLKWFTEDLMKQNPVDRVEIEVLPVFVYTGAMSSFGPLLGALSQLRGEYNAPPEQYYYGLTRPCDGGADGVGGQAFGIPSNPTKGNAYQRVAMGRQYNGIGSTSGTFVHEIGHTQGRRHVACSGGEGGPDNTYPYEGGDIGVWGFDIFNFSLHPPTNHDYMTYCGQTWVSDWGWNKVYWIIETLSSWDMEDKGSDDPQIDQATELGTVLIGALYPDGTEDWWTAAGNLEGETISGAHHLEFTDTSGVVSKVPVKFSTMPEGETKVIVAELTRSLDTVTAIERVSGDDRASVTLADVKRIASEPQ